VPKGTALAAAQRNHAETINVATQNSYGNSACWKSDDVFRVWKLAMV